MSKPRLKAAKEILLSIPEKLKHQSCGFSYSRDKGYLAETDLMVHDHVCQSLREHFPDDHIISEEDSFSDSSKEEIEYSWILDPVCGTTNYLYKIPFFAHSLSYCLNGKVMGACIFDSVHGELFWTDGQHSYLNEHLITVSQTECLDQALISLNCNQSRKDKSDPYDTIEELTRQFAPPVCRRIHILESANLELAYVACGRLDAYINPHDKLWDVSAGSLLIRCAGGHSRFFHEYGNSSGEIGIVASNTPLFSDICRRIWPVGQAMTAEEPHEPEKLL
ncbi:MAG: hypothetical protein H6618_08170 [Deltaproteobacteria bacterium]|nr:hypothetical protein [Deltaproteobacteria bacterium]